jgi:hypothetical protein
MTQAKSQKTVQIRVSPKSRLLMEKIVVAYDLGLNALTVRYNIRYVSRFPGDPAGANRPFRQTGLLQQRNDVSGLARTRR